MICRYQQVKTQVDNIINEINKTGSSVILNTTSDKHVISGLLITWFKNLEEPYFTNSLYDKLLKYADNQIISLKYILAMYIFNMNEVEYVFYFYYYYYSHYYVIYMNSSKYY